MCPAAPIESPMLWMVVEPMAGDHLEDNLNPVSRLYLRRLDPDLRADLESTGSRRRAWRAGRRDAAERGDRQRRLPLGAAGSRDAVQHDPRDAALTGSFDGPLPRSKEEGTIRSGKPAIRHVHVLWRSQPCPPKGNCALQRPSNEVGDQIPMM